MGGKEGTNRVFRGAEKEEEARAKMDFGVSCIRGERERERGAKLDLPSYTNGSISHSLSVSVSLLLPRVYCEASPSFLPRAIAVLE